MRREREREGIVDSICISQKKMAIEVKQKGGKKYREHECA